MKKMVFPTIGTTIAVGMLAAGGVGGADGDGAAIDGFTGHEFRQEGQTMPYRLLAPEKLEAGKRYPLILSMHGMGSIGDDNRKQLFLAGMVASRPEVKREQAFVLAPQCPTTDRWVKVASWNEETHVFAPEPTQAMKLAMAILDHVVSSYPIDPERIYVGGGSMGGFATWELLARRPGFFAAAFAICGGGCVAQADAIAKTPVWAFHGTDDTTVLLRNSQEMTAAVKKGGGEVKFTEYPGVQHDAWTPALKEPELFRWLFEHKKKPGSVSPSSDTKTKAQ